jgi:hypothetical protein
VQNVHSDSRKSVASRYARSARCPPFEGKILKIKYSKS